jgi:CDP-4-dehydro-6-deoxyglucose reductase
MNRIRLYPSGREVPCPDGDTVLSALEQAGYALPNNCRAGACGECKVKVRSGHFDQGMVLDMALSQAERKEGLGLMCMAKPLSDVLEIEWGTEDARPKLYPPGENVPFILIDKTPLTPGISAFRLRPLGPPLRYWPGQYVMAGDEEAGVPARCYSIANAPRPDGEILLQVTRVDDGATSRWLHDRIQPGDPLRLSGPYGTFIGDPSVDTPVLCLAAGSGLAPIRALTDAALSHNFAKPVTLLFSARTRQDLFDRGMMAFWEATHRNFRYRYTLTGESDAPLTGRIPAILPGLFRDLSGHSVFVAGAPGFVTDCVAAVRTLGGREDRIHTERYVPQGRTEGHRP